MAAPAGWEPVQRVPTYELVLRRIEEQLINRTLRPGDRLPPERELATMLGASRPAVREALRVLQAQGVVRSAVGTGVDSGTIVTQAPSGALTRLLRVHLAVASFPLSDVVESRVMFERFSALGAAKAMTPEVLARIEEPLLAMDEPDIERARFNELDTEFHVAIAEAGGNQFIADLTVAVRESIRGDILGTLEQAGDWPEIRAGLRADHHAIYRALAAADGPGAADALERHIEGFYARMQIGVSS
ncbi:FadR/GntR family transcriptional regulator [Nakamurella sp.]|uniref:FadR/GntR family transcriptional regulator n=1 Tax=Nakamurella sp. TaxID=1869182 RepID=UPI003B3A05B5